MATTPQNTSQHRTVVLTGKERLALAQQELARLRARLNRSSGLTAVVGIVALLLLGGYFYYGSLLWAEFSEPKSLVDLAQITLDDYLLEARSALEREVIKSAPSWAEKLSKDAIAYVPEARKQFQKLAIEQLELSLQETELVTEAEFRKFLRKHRALMDKRFKDLSEDKNLAEQSVTELFNALEEDLQVDLKADAANLLKLVKSLNTNARDMRFGAKLSDDQKLERNAWMIGRRIYLQTFDPTLLKKYEVAAGATKAPKRIVPQPKKGPEKQPKTSAKSVGKPAKE